MRLSFDIKARAGLVAWRTELARLAYVVLSSFKTKLGCFKWNVCLPIEWICSHVKLLLKFKCPNSVQSDVLNRMSTFRLIGSLVSHQKRN